MSRKLAPVLAAWVGFLLLAGGVVAQSPAPAVTGKLELTVKLVKKDLSVIPAPKKAFKVASADPAAGVAESLTTTFEGTASVDLPAGKYVLTSAQPIELEGAKYSWSVPFEVRAGAATKIELSNDNAAAEAAGAPAGAAVTAEGAIFREVKPRVFKIIAEAGSGSGFLVDAAGLVLTNHHVVENAGYLAVKVDAKRKVPAVLAADDPNNDLAVLLVNPDAVKGLEALRLANDTAEQPTIAAGDRVLAVGSPLATETILTSGIVSKVEGGVIYSDVAINPGNSGGPLFSMAGEVVGVNTFGMQAKGGPGVAGVVRIHVARPLVDAARGNIATLAAPPARLLPEASDYRFPPEKLKEIVLAAPYDPKSYVLKVPRLEVQVFTPVSIAGVEVKKKQEAAAGRAKRTKGTAPEYKSDDDFYDWRKYAGDFRPVVTVQAFPEVTMSGGSKFGVFMLGGAAPQKYKFKTDFEKMELLRDGKVVEPILPGRIPNVVNVQAGNRSFKDVAYYGLYEYPPEAFLPPASLALKIYEPGKPAPEPIPLPPEVLQRIRADFGPYFDAMPKEGAGPGDGKN